MLIDLVQFYLNLYHLCSYFQMHDNKSFEIMLKISFCGKSENLIRSVLLCQSAENISASRPRQNATTKQRCQVAVFTATFRKSGGF